MFAAESGRVKILRTTIDVLLEASKLMLLAATFLSIAFVGAYSKLRDSLEKSIGIAGVLSSVILVSISLLAAAVAHLAGLLRIFDIHFLKLYRNITGFAIERQQLNSGDLPTAMIRFVLTAPFVRYRSPYEDQERFVAQVVRSLGDNNKRGSRFILEGSASTGKTTAIALLIEKIAINKTLSHLIRRIYYFDLSQSWTSAPKIATRYEHGDFNGAILVLDNFHCVARQELRRLTVLFLEAGIGGDICVIFTLHDARDLAVSGGEEVQLVKDIRKSGRLYRLSGLDQDFAVGQIDPIERSFRETAPITRRWATHALRMASNRQALATFYNLIEPREYHSKIFTNKRHEAFLALVVSESLGTGGFSHQDFRLALTALVRWNDASFMDALAMRAMMRHLVKKGAIMKVVTDRVLYIFHTDLAFRVKEAFRHRSHFERCLKFLLTVKAKSSLESGNVLDAWRYAIIAGMHKVLGRSVRSLFSEALLTGRYQLMLSTLTSVGADIGASSSREFHRAAGVLNELTANFEAASAHMARAERGLTDRRQQAELRLHRLELDHTSNIHNVLNDLETIKQLGFADLALTARYWTIHVKIHLGEFHYEEMEAVIAELLENYNTWFQDRKFEGSHLLRRMYFDLYRLAYLQGNFPFQRLQSLQVHPAALLIAEVHPLFSGYFLKNAEAQYLHYQAIFEHAIVERYSSQAACTGAFQNLRLGELVNKALAAYEQAVREFNYFGYKSSASLQLRLAELDLMLPVRDFECAARRTRSFLEYAERSQFPDYFGNAYTILGKIHYLQSLALLEQDAKYNNLAEHDHSRAKSLHYLKLARQQYANGENQYGVLRAELLTDLLQSQIKLDSSEFFTKWLSRIDTMSAASYCREATLINLVRQHGLTPSLIHDVFAYYPTVIQ